MYQLLDAEDRANKAALLLAFEMYQERYSSFIRNEARAAYARRDLLEMIDEICTEVGADTQKVAARFFEVLAEKKEKKDKLPESLEGIQTTDVMERGEVEGAGLEEALNPKGLKKEDLGSETDKKSRVTAYSASEAGDLKNKETWKSCFRCDNKLNPVVAQRSPVCPDCTEELRREAAPYGDGTGTGVGTSSPDAAPAPVNPNQQYQCVLCVKNGTQFTGTYDQVQEHVQQQHQAELNQPTQTGPYPTEAKTAEREPVEVGGETPADRFDDYIQQVADRAAARQFSQPSDEEVQTIAQQYGLEDGDVRSNVFVVATFGNVSAGNGEIDNTEVPEGYEEVQSVGGRVESHEALIPVETAIAKVADDMNMERDLVYNMVRDRYGADLPDKYHASISGEYKFYLPTTLIGEQNDVGPSANPEVVAEEATPVG